MKKILIIINIVVTWCWGITAMIYGMIVISIISYYLNRYYIVLLIGYPIWEQLQDLISYLIMAVLMGLAAYAAGFLPLPNLWSMLLVQITLGIVVYLCLCRVFRLMAFMEIWQGGWKEISFLRAGTENR
jgi:teichuronic acid exporter